MNEQQAKAAKTETWGCAAIIITFFITIILVTWICAGAIESKV